MNQNHWKSEEKVRKYVKSAEKRLDSKYKPFAEHIITLINKYDINHHPKILDLGCGPGFLLFELKKGCSNSQIFGIDPSEEMLKAARSKASEFNINDYKFKRGIAEEIPFPDSHFQVVICLSSLHDFQDAVRTIQETFRVLEDGGIFILKDRNKSYPRWKLYFQFFKLAYDSSLKGASKFVKSRERWFKSSKVLEWMEKEGFTVKLLNDNLEYLIVAIK